jgi:hypothetical protein
MIYYPSSFLDVFSEIEESENKGKKEYGSAYIDWVNLEREDALGFVALGTDSSQVTK